jgi:hypothetical protein
MTNVSIVPIATADNGFLYYAVAGSHFAQGKTVGQALDALSALFSPEESGAFVVVQSLRPDQFFTAEQQERLSSLMEHWKGLQSKQEVLPLHQQRELESLVEAELLGSAARAAAMAEAVGR